MASRDLWRWMAGPQCRAWQDCRDPDLPLPPLLGSFCNDFAIGALAVAPFSRGAGGAGSEPLGLVTIHSPVPRPWDENKCRWLEAVADLVAHGFERASLLEDLNRYADDLESAKADLERRVAERTAQLVHMERAAMLGAVTAGVVHDIRNPLITLSGYHRLTRRCLDQLSAHLEGSSMGSSVAELEDRFRKAEQAALGVIDVVENMLGFARKETRIDTLDIPAVIREALRLLSSVLVGVRAEVRTPPAGVKSRGSHAHLLQVIMNLVANAGHAVKETPDPQVVIRCAADENLVTIRVEDNGPGVPEPLRSQLFRPFFTTKAGAGTGLGLMISRHIVEGMGGALSYQNSELGGACFVIRLPAAQEGAYHETP
jgi:two-component system C4-dicarboxylate transport sensor histidine kinase DctB